MAQSLSNVLVHFIFSTKDRARILQDPWREELHAYITGVLKNNGANCIIVNSVADHVHMLLPLPRTKSVADIMQAVKSGSSGWINEKFAAGPRFHWQRGYGAFSVSPAHKNDVVRYIASQEEHHKTVTFQDEFRRLLVKYEIPFEEAYVWD